MGVESITKAVNITKVGSIINNQLCPSHFAARTKRLL